ncbi:MAG: NAD(P)H-quinone oxidoreductase subunit J [candidate division BRC1 bacterium ADurb.BinA364]|nr:MAG: NAD(P)H-quinone oxidoreductase subunit J [candidate division BRC1 bacterium ADurb.BinA364]
MDTKDIYAALAEKFGQDIAFSPENLAGDPFVTVAPGRFRETMEFLKSDPAMAMDQLLLVTGVDRGDSIEAVYHLYSYTHFHLAVVKAALDRQNPEIDSVADLWAAADWHERETYDMLGVRFRGHPHLRRILLPDDWEGYPLRRDYVAPAEYHGVTNDLHTEFFDEKGNRK